MLGVLMLFIILLLEGFITISVEIITMRQLVPFFGGSVVITSIIIGFFLLFLAMGYWRGGGCQGNFFSQLSRNFTLSLIWIGVGLSYSLIAVYHYASITLLRMPFLLSLSLYLVLVLAPIVYWLGQTVPLTTNLFNQQHRVSRISGRALFLSTIGSFLGALLTALLLFQYLGVAWTVVFNVLLLFVLVVYLREDSRMPWWQVGALLLVLVCIMQLNLTVEHAQFKRTNNYANYRVLGSADLGKLLDVNESASSLLTPDKKGFPYIEFVRDLLFRQLDFHDKQLLVIGAGGFSLTAAGTHGNTVTYVDIDPDIKMLSETYFLNEPIHGTFVPEDARAFLQHSSARFDVIFSDAYSHHTTVPPSLLTVEYFEALANHLNQGGLLFVNMIASPFFKDDYSRLVFNTIHAVFSYCLLIPMNWEHPLANVMYVCPKVDTNVSLYRDDLNTATLDFFKAHVS